MNYSELLAEELITESEGEFDDELNRMRALMGLNRDDDRVLPKGSRSSLEDDSTSSTRFDEAVRLNKLMISVQKHINIKF